MYGTRQDNNDYLLLVYKVHNTMPTASNESQRNAGKKLHHIGHELMIHIRHTRI